MTVIEPTHNRIFIGLHGGSIVFCCILILLLVDCIDLRHKKIASSNIKYYSIISISLYAISSILMLIWFILVPNGTVTPGDINDHLFQMSWGLFWRLGQAFLYLLFLERLKHSFKSTKYASSPRTFWIFYIGIILFLISYIIRSSIYCYLYRNNHDEDTDSLYAIVGDIDMGVTQIIDLSLSIGIMTLFLNKLYKLNVDLTDINFLNGSHQIMTHSLSINGSNHSHRSHQHSHSNLKYSKPKKRKLSLNQRQKSVIGIMAKITLLSGIALLSSQILLFLGGGLYLTEIFWKDQVQLLWSLKMGYFAINTVIISGSIALSFDFSYKWYKKICRINKICIKCCTWSTKKKITKISSSSFDNLLTSNISNISSNVSSPNYDSGYNIDTDDDFGYVS